MSEDKKRRAVVERREQVSSLPRPERLDTGTDLRAEVAEVHETADLYRVYVRDWLIHYTTDATGEDGIAEALRVYTERYAGRVHSDDYKIYSHGPAYSAVVQLRVPVLRGEFKHEADALAEAENLEGAEVVVRNSASDYKLREYGVKKLGPGQ